MKRVKVLLVLVALVAITGMVSDAWAQCVPQGRIFRSSGKFGNNFRIDVTGTDNTTNQIGRFWDSQNSANSNNGLVDGSLCDLNLPLDGWWESFDATTRFIDGVLDGGLCIQQGCPLDQLTIVVEDYDSNGPPGIGGTAYYVGWKTDETPASARWYDYGNVDGAMALTVAPMLEFPKVDITSSARSGMTINVNYNLADQAGNILTWDHNTSTQYPDVDVVKEWQLMKATSLTDPGRARAAWTMIQTTPYVPGGAAQFDAVPCTDTVNDEWLAVGIGFQGGAGPTVNSALVGEAVQLECDPNLADPGGQIHEIKPTKQGNTELQSQPGRTGGRR